MGSGFAATSKTVGEKPVAGGTVGEKPVAGGAVGEEPVAEEPVAGGIIIMHSFGFAATRILHPGCGLCPQTDQCPPLSPCRSPTGDCELMLCHERWCWCNIYRVARPGRGRTRS